MNELDTPFGKAIKKSFEAPGLSPENILLKADAVLQSSSMHPAQTNYGRRPLTRALGIPAIALVPAAVIAIVGVQYTLTNSNTHLRAPGSLKTYATQSGQRAKLTLPDGSSIVLAPQSRLSYSSDFGSSSRIVTLDGQALFTVTHSSGVPFIVKTGNVDTRVLGTSFGIRKYPSDSAVQVVVAQGRVSVNSELLGTGDRAEATAGKKPIVTRGVDVAVQLAWAEGRLVFVYTPLAEVIPALERWYGVKIHVVNQSLLDKPVSTTLDTESATRAMELVAFAVGARVETHGSFIVFHALR